MKRPTLLLTLLALTQLAAGALEPLALPPGTLFSPTGFIQMIAGAILLYAWCKADAAERHTVPPHGAAIWCALLAPVGVPYYLFRSRPWKEALAGVAKAIGFLVLMYALFYGAFIAKQYLFAS